jgi:hypothetical protein
MRIHFQTPIRHAPALTLAHAHAHAHTLRDTEHRKDGLRDTTEAAATADAGEKPL